MNSYFYIFTLLSLPYFGHGQFTFHDIDNSTFGNYVTEVITTSDGVMVATRGEKLLCHYDGSDWTKYDYTQYGFTGNLAISSASDLKQDKEGNYWLAYRSTVDIFDGSTVNTLTSSNSELQADNVKALAFDSEGTLYLGYGNSSGISIRKEGTWTHDNNHVGEMAPLNDVFRPFLITYDEVNDAIWIYDGGDIFQIKGETTTKFTWEDGLPSLSSDDVTGMATTDDGKVWFSINDNSFDDGGLLVYDGVTWEHITSSNSDLPEDDVYAIAAHGDNILIGGATSRKISYFNGSTWKTYTNANSNYPDFGPQFFYDIAVWDERAYVGSSGGVIELDLSIQTSTADRTQKHAITLHPNPVAAMLTLDTTSPYTRVEIRNTAGQLLQTEYNTAKQLNVQQLMAGVYYIVVHLANGERLHEQFVKL